MYTTPNAGLTVWDQGTDSFSHTQLKVNWDTIDTYFGGFDNTSKKVKHLNTVSSLPGSPAAGDICMLNTAVGGFPAWTVIRYDGSAWQGVGGISVQSSLPVSNLFAGMIVVLSTATTNFPQWSVVRYNGTTWDHVGIFGYVNTGALASNILGAQINGDVYYNNSARGPILIDRTTTNKYRLFIDNGTLEFEQVS